MAEDDVSRGPHPATVPRGGAAQPRLAKKARGPHPATVSRGGAAQARPAKKARGPHPATVSRGRTEPADKGADVSITFLAKDDPLQKANARLGVVALRLGEGAPLVNYWFSIGDRGKVEDAPPRVYRGAKTAKPFSGLPSAFKAPLGALLATIGATSS